jgi:DNA-binding transcriptional LysR family regulator
MGLDVTADLQKRYPGAAFEYHVCDEDRALEEVAEGEAHLALVTGEVPRELTGKALAEAKFLTVAGPGHPLYGQAKAKKPVPVQEVIKHPFVSPSRPILGQVGLKQSLDGWRDDEFTRNVAYLTTSLKLLEALVSTGRALAYLPDYYADQLGVLAIKVTGCPYTCTQKIKLVARRPQDTGWLNQVF